MSTRAPKRFVRVWVQTGTQVSNLCWGHASGFGVDGGHAHHQTFDGETNLKKIPSKSIEPAELT